MLKNKRFTYILSAIIAALLIIFSSLFAGGGIPAYAATAANSTVEAYEQNNVLDDLKGSTIDSKEFNIADYPFDEKKDVQILSFVEYGYSFYSDKQNDYGLYIYIYNPKGLSFADSDRNKIQIEFNKNNRWVKYSLKFINYSAAAGCEGLFYKYKIVLNDSQRSQVLSDLVQNSRIYSVSGVELSSNSTVTDYKIGRTYTYSGFALGYGSEVMTETSLTCTTDGIKEVLSLDVHPTYYRPAGTNGTAYTRDTLHSVYFSVPNKIIDEYGNMIAVHATWLNAQTAPVFVTGNKDVYNAVYGKLGQYVSGGSFQSSKDDNSYNSIDYSLIASKYIESASFNNVSYGLSYMSFNENRTYTNSDVALNYLYYCFLADNADSNADDYILPAEALVGDKEKGVDGWLKWFTDYALGSGLVGTGMSGSLDYDLLFNDRYLKYLFSNYDDSFTDITLTADDTFTLTDEIISKSLWQKFVGGGYKVSGKNEYKVSAIQKVTSTDINVFSSSTAFCDKFYVDPSDYDEFTEYVKNAEKNNETVYLFRYYQSDYTHYEVAEYKRDKGDWTMVQGSLFDYKFLDTNAYFMQMWVQLDFDIIDLTFTKDGVDTVIPVVMSPIDIAADSGQTLFPTDDDGLLAKLGEWGKRIAIILIVIVVIILLILFAPVLNALIKGLFWLISLPFKAIAKLFKSKDKKPKNKGDRYD